MGDSEKRIRDDGVPPQSLSILLCVVATFGVALEELNWEQCIPEDTRYHK